MKKLIMSVFGAVAMAAAAFAGDGSFAYQGVLRDEQGQALKSATATITFRLYNVADGGALLWDKELTVALATNGLFNVELSGKAKSVKDKDLDTVVADAAANNLPLYIALYVKDSSGEIRPRQKMISAPSALYAYDVQHARGDFTVDGIGIFKDNLSVVKSISASNAQFRAMTIDSAIVLNKTQLQGGATVGETLAMNTATVAGELTISGDLTVKGSSRNKNGAEIGVPVGCILMWSGAYDEIPAGWALCDGQEHALPDKTKRRTPDLRKKFVVGADLPTAESDEYKQDAQGGQEKVRLTVAQMPEHQHHLGNSNDWWHVEVDDNTDYKFAVPWAVDDKHTVTGKSGQDSHGDTNKQGGGQEHENRPPYYALYYIMRLY